MLGIVRGDGDIEVIEIVMYLAIMKYVFFLSDI